MFSSSATEENHAPVISFSWADLKKEICRLLDAEVINKNTKEILGHEAFRGDNRDKINYILANILYLLNLASDRHPGQSHHIVELLSVSTSKANIPLDYIITKFGNSQIVPEYLKLLSALQAKGIDNMTILGIKDTFLSSHAYQVLNHCLGLITSKEAAEKVSELLHKDKTLPHAICKPRNPHLHRIYHDIIEKVFTMGVDPERLTDLLILPGEPNISIGAYCSNIDWFYTDGKSYDALLAKLIIKIVDQKNGLPFNSSLKNYKEIVGNYILNLKDSALREGFLRQATDESQPLGKYFFLKRGLFKPNLGSGVLSNLNKALKKIDEKNPAPPSLAGSRITNHML